MIWIWTAFILFVLSMLALDLGVFHRKAHVVRVGEALKWSGVWIALALLFSVFVYFGYENQWMGLGTYEDTDGAINDGKQAVIKYLTGYVVEESLSVDNMFVIAAIFRFFHVAPLYQHRVLFWGILGALIMRGLMIGIGAELIRHYHWVLYLFGAFLIFTAIRMLTFKESDEAGENIIVRWARKLFPVTERFHGEHFTVIAGSKASQEAPTRGAPPHRDLAVEKAKPGTRMLTPLALALITVETTDLIFAVDSIPAIFIITADPFLVFTSNVFAILGLRSLYFALAGMIDKFRYLKVSLAVILAVVGLKMLFAEWLRATFPAIKDSLNFLMLGLIALILLGGVLASMWMGGSRKAMSPET